MGITETTGSVPVPPSEDLELARTLGLMDTAVLIHELRRIAWNGNPWAARYGVITACKALRRVGDVRPLPEERLGYTPEQAQAKIDAYYYRAKAGE